MMIVLYSITILTIIKYLTITGDETIFKFLHFLKNKSIIASRKETVLLQV